MSEPIIDYREEFNVIDMARKYAERVARVIDEQTLANVEDQLVGYGYVKVVRCRDCKHYKKLSDDKGACHPLGIVFADMDDGYCAWAVRKEGGE